MAIEASTRKGELEGSDILVLEPQRLVQPHGPDYPRGGPNPRSPAPIRAGDEFYFEDQGGIAPKGEISPNLYGILVFLLNQLLQRSLSNDVRRRVEGYCGGEC